MHALGFRHEHQRYDRDKYVEVFRDNVKPGFWESSFATFGFNDFEDISGGSCLGVRLSCQAVI